LSENFIVLTSRKRHEKSDSILMKNQILLLIERYIASGYKGKDDGVISDDIMEENYC